MKNIEKFNLKKKLIVLSTFGHCGVDWLHSLLDDHKQILIIPSLSFYRKSEIVKKKFKINTKNKMLFVEKLLDLLLKTRTHTMRLKILRYPQKKTLFKKYVYHYLSQRENFNLNKDLFEAIHFAYVKINNIDIKKKKVIVAHEHLPWNCYKYKKYFDTKFVLILRDPRASIAGSIKYLKRFTQQLTGYQIDMIFSYFLSAFALSEQTNKKKLYVIRNEKMNLNLKKEMKKLSNWMGVNYDKSMLDSTLLGKKWNGESAYIAKNDLRKKVPKNYYNIKNVKARWMKVLNYEQTKQIATVLYKIFNKFNYKKRFNESFTSNLRNYFRFTLNIDFQKNFKNINIIRMCKNFIKRTSIIKFNKLIKYFFI